MYAKSFKDLIVWQRSMELVKEIYSLTSEFPKNELYGLSSQMQRAAVSIPSNLAEGYFRGHKQEFLQFMSIAMGSAAELQTQILICQSINNFSKLNFEKATSLLEEVLKMLFTMRKNLKK